ncbi:Uncharacterised protein [Mycobacteroides abscessus]|nr:Uncharacterised protein [Mycobacteroides abscessus]
MLSGPSTPAWPPAPPVYSSVVVDSLRTGPPSGVRNVSSRRSELATSIWAVTATVEFPAPTTRSSIACTCPDTFSSYCPACSPDERAPTPTSESTSPCASTTATSVGAMPSIDAETRWTIASTCSVVSFWPRAGATNTDAVGVPCSAAKTVSSGIASWTVAVSTPSIAERVRASSPSSARLYVTSCWNSLDVTPISSSSE